MRSVAHAGRLVRTPVAGGDSDPSGRASDRRGDEAAWPPSRAAPARPSPVAASSTNLLRAPLVPVEVAEVVAWLGSDAASEVDCQIVNVFHGAIVSR